MQVNTEIHVKLMCNFTKTAHYCCEIYKQIELSKNFNFPKNKFHDVQYHFSTVQFDVFTAVDKNYSLDAKVIGNLLLTFWRILHPPLSGWRTKCMLFGRIGHILQGLIRLGDIITFLQCFLQSHDRILPEMHVRSPSSGPTYSP